MSEHDRRSLWLHHLKRHLHIIHGIEIPKGTKNRGKLSEELHEQLHDEGFCAHPREDV